MAVERVYGARDRSGRQCKLLKDLGGKLARAAAAATVCALLVTPPHVRAAQSIYGRERVEPNMLKMGADLLIARPVLLGFTVLGSALYLISLPFSAAGGNLGQASEVLVVGPARATFKRCLGCANSDEKEAGPRSGIY